MIKKVLKALAVLVSISIVFILVYNYNYSMSPAKSFEVNDPDLTESLLIATQGSEFKNALVSQIIESNESRDIYIKVVDVSALSEIIEDDWTAIVIIHTWEKWEPQEDALAFIKKAKNLEDIYTIATSGSGEEIIFGVDGISGASEISRIPKIVKELDSWLNTRFD